MACIGVVAIGRNEGERLERCLRSIGDAAARVVYVDSGSSDGSVAFARSLGIDLVELDMNRPFTMARGRNAGFEHLTARMPEIDRIQFVDGDCEIQPGWLETASRFLDEHPDVAVVCGRRRERHPTASRYNRLIDMEWAGPVGDVESCGGDAMIRARVLARVGGYDERLIAGEEPELCFRIRRVGYRVVRLGDEMTLHDAALFHFGQWWRRSVRAGHACAESAWLHGRGPERYRLRQVASILTWSLVLPLGVAVSAWYGSGFALFALAAYPVLAFRIYRRRREAAGAGGALLYAAACVVGKWAQLQGMLHFAINRLVLRRSAGLIEYKGPAPG